MAHDNDDDLAGDNAGEVDVGHALRGLAITPLPQGWIPVDAICVVKCLNAAGEPLWVLRPTRSLNEEELLGALVVQTELLKRDLLESWSDD